MACRAAGRGAAIADLWRTSARQGCGFRSMRPRRSTLEEVFLSALAGAGREEPAAIMQESA